MSFTNLNTAWPMRDLLAQAKVASGQYTGPALYTPGGEAVDLSAIGLSEVWYWAPMVFTNGTVIIMAIYDATANTLKFFDMTGAEMGAVDLSTYTSTFFVTGK